MTSSSPYQNPVAQLLLLKGSTNWNDEWIDYPQAYGLTLADVPELVRLSWDEDPQHFEGAELGADSMVHALRALIQLDPMAGIKLYLDLLKEFPQDDWLNEDAKSIGKQAGGVAIAPFVEVLGDSSRDDWNRVAVSEALEAIALTYPEHRDAVVQALIQELQRYQEREEDILDSNLASSLIELKVVEAADLMEEVFAANKIDEWVTGSWPAVQVELGLKQESDFSPEELKPTPKGNILAIQQAAELLSQRFGGADQAAAAIASGNFLDLINRQTEPKKSGGQGFAAKKPGKKGKKKKR